MWHKRSWWYLEFILLIFSSFVEWPIIAKSPNMIHFIEAFDVVWDAFSLQDLLALRDGSHSIDLQICIQMIKERNLELQKPRKFIWI